MIIKNNTKENIFIEDLHLKIPFKESVDLTKLKYSIEELEVSIELKDLIYVNDVIVNDGVSDLEINDALNSVSTLIVCEEKDLLASFKGGTEKQVLTKASNKDFDFIWTTL